MDKEYEFRGVLIWADLYGIKSDLLDNPKALEQLCIIAAEKAGMKVYKSILFRFEPQGCDVYVSLLESSIVMHTYPEHDSCFVDIFTCGNSNPLEALDYIISMLSPERYEFESVPRGRNRADI